MFGNINVRNNGNLIIKSVEVIVNNTYYVIKITVSDFNLSETVEIKLNSIKDIAIDLVESNNKEKFNYFVYPSEAQFRD